MKDNLAVWNIVEIDVVPVYQTSANITLLLCNIHFIKHKSWLVVLGNFFND